MAINSLILSVIASSMEFMLCLLCCVKLWKHRTEGDRSRLLLAASSFVCVMTSTWNIIDVLQNGFNFQYSEMQSPLIGNLGIFCQLVLFCYPLEVMRPGWFKGRNVLLLFSPWIILTLIQVSGVLHFRTVHSLSEMIAYSYEANVMLRWVMSTVFILLSLVLLLIPYNMKESSADWKWVLNWALAVPFMQSFAVAFHFTHIIFFHCAHQIFVGLFFHFSTQYELKVRLFPPSEDDAGPATDVPAENPDIMQDLKNGNNDLWTRINDVIENGELWKDSDLSLSVLSRLVFSNRTYVSKTFKEESGMTFADYIKRKRIDYVARLLEKNPTQNIKNLFFEAGYRSYPTAWRHFKEIKGMLPTEYAATLGNNGGGKKSNNLH